MRPLKPGMYEPPLEQGCRPAPLRCWRQKLACGLAGRTSILGLWWPPDATSGSVHMFFHKTMQSLAATLGNFPLFIDSMRLLRFIALASGLLAIICEFASCCSGPTPSVSSQIVASVPHCVTLLGDCLHARTRIGHIMARPPIVPNPIPHRPSLSRWQTMVVSKAISRLLLTERDRGIS